MTFTYRVLLKPSDICFKKKLLPSSFDDGIPLQETLQQLANEEILLEDLPCIDVVWCQKKWVWYTLNNRRLWVFRELEKLGKCQYIATRRVENIEHVTDFLLHDSAELIGESNVVEWDKDGFRITLFNADAKKDAKSPGKEIPVQKTKEKVREDPQIRRDWREMTPLTVTIRWNEANKSDAEDARVVIPDPNTKPSIVRCQEASQEERVKREQSQRERKDSGYSALSSGQTSPRDLSDDETLTEYETVFSETEFSEDKDRKSRRFSRFDRDRPSRSYALEDETTSTSVLKSFAHSYSRPPSRVLKSSGNNRRSNRTRQSRRRRQRFSPARPSTLRASMFRRRDAYDRSMLLLHHGGMSRLEQLALKTKLMNTCGFCFKNFREGVSLSQHIEELKHWTCTRCGKYFESYTALGQHKLALDHCNVY